jgi:hypothetical protein
MDDPTASPFMGWSPVAHLLIRPNSLARPFCPRQHSAVFIDWPQITNKRRGIKSGGRIEVDLEELVQYRGRTEWRYSSSFECSTIGLTHLNKTCFGNVITMLPIIHSMNAVTYLTCYQIQVTKGNLKIFGLMEYFH